MNTLKEQLNAAMAHQVENRLNDAEAIYLEILEVQPDQPDAVHLLGLIRAEQERDDEAVVLMERALELFPNAAHFHHNIAGIYRRLGRLDEAEAEFRAALELKADYGEAYQGLAEMVKFKAGDPLIERVQNQLANEQASHADRSYFHFALGKIMDDVGDYPSAFENYKAANRLADRPFDTAQHRQMIKDILYVYGRAANERREGSGLATEVPTFVVGMPRSGTTLIEQILASHSQVYGAGELNDLKIVSVFTAQVSAFKQAYPNSIPGIRNADYARLSGEYLKRLKRAAREGDWARIVDKHPLNFQYVGLIYSMFPNARVIHTVRNPLDTCLSCFFQNFTKGQNYSFDLETLAHFYNDYRRLMDHWETLYPGKIYTIRYEDIIADQASETRKLLDYMGLEFEPGCIDFHKTDRKVSTASFLQVRKPIYRSSQQRWKRYSNELAELARLIGIATTEPVTISQQEQQARTILS